MRVPVSAQGTTGRRLARRYMRKERNVVRIIRLTAVFLALMTPSAPRNGWCDPPMAASSFESAIIVCGVPHTMIADSKELAAMGGSHHPFLGALGVMSAKNTAVNLMILTTFLSFLMYRRAERRPAAPSLPPGSAARLRRSLCVSEGGSV